MNIRSWLFPSQSRFFIGQRWVSIVLRSLHLIGIAGIGAAFLFEVNKELWQPFMSLSLATGLAMILLETWSNAIWIFQMRGLATLLKLALLSMTFVIGLQPYILYAVILISGIISHAPARFRHYTFVRSRIDSR